jgi:hypothetical protein
MIALSARLFPLRKSGGIDIRVGLDWKDPAKAQGFLVWADEARRLLRAPSGERIYGMCHPPKFGHYTGSEEQPTLYKLRKG